MPVKPALEQYSGAFMLKAAEEARTMRRSCAAGELSDDCSAIRTMFNDYWTLRERIGE